MAGDPVRDAFRAQLAMVSGHWTIKDTEATAPQPDAGAQYLTIEWMDGDERLFAWGAPGTNLYKESSFLQIHAVQPKGKGSAAAELQIRAIRDYFRDKRFTTSASRNVRVVSVSPLGGEANGPNWIESVLLEFETFNVG